MRALLITYEFPPSESPQGIRAREIAMGLSRSGWDVEVLAPSVPGVRRAEDAAFDGLKIHRATAGWLTGFVAFLAAHRARGHSADPGEGSGPYSPGDDAPPDDGEATGESLNWKGRLFERLSKLMGRFLFPDVRGEWNPWARRALRNLMDRRRPDVVVCFHEPASTLELGLYCRSRGVPVVADLGDPVLADYTPTHWRTRAEALEARVCRKLDHVVVTTAQARELLAQRHGLESGRCSVVSQGFDDQREPGACQLLDANSHGPLQLLYTGRFYRFRRPEPLLDAVLATPDVNLTIVSPTPMSACDDAAVESGGRITVLGRLPHQQVLDMQLQADVLVSIGNKGMPAQTPGKIFEYLGSGRPVLHLRADASDAGAGVVDEFGAGWVCSNDSTDIGDVLERLAQQHRDRQLHAGLAWDQERISAHGWRQLSQRYSDILAGVAAMPAGRGASGQRVLDQGGIRSGETRHSSKQG